ncbi:hypothetical protein F5050DRAFT_780029 [Lentinula boryana]|uniref:F-box domain-containing protein n=1 Tax=Lentinula boryana TaxID=40481 RepID=A0ABQ8Q3M8_9AGAR|nr:hypothetical protein F5050DRAFT_780029 [Lentinula boryana]
MSTTTTPLDDPESVDVTPFALRIPEILENIFEHSDENSNRTNNVLVCKAWSDPCLNVIWRELKDLSCLVKLLGPTVIRGSRLLDFSQTDKPPKWDRFSFYARRVRKIYHMGEKAGTYRAGLALRSVFTDIAYQRLSNNIVPNLQVLEWHSDAFLYMQNPSILFMGPSLKHYILHEVKPSPAELSLNLQTLADRCPHINHVKISLDSATQSHGDIILDFVMRMAELHTLELPPFGNMAPLINALRGHSCLRKLQIGGCHAIDGQLDKPCITSLALPSPGGDHFASLTFLSIVVPYAVVEKLFSSKFPSLQQISIFSDLRKPETPSTIKHLIDTLTERCPQIHHIRLSYAFLPEEKYTRFPPASCIVTMAHIRPLLRCSKMQNFTFKHPFPITLDDQFAEEIATSWPDLLELQLNNVPLVRRKDFKNCFTLRALLPFARHCPRLVHLSILVVPESSTCPILGDIQSLPSSFFSKLYSFDVGSSMLYESDKHQVALTLSQILPPHSVLRYHNSVKNDLSSDTDEETPPSSPEARNWNSVMNEIPYMRWMDQLAKTEQRELRRKLQELETENERLRTQTQTLHA